MLILLDKIFGFITMFSLLTPKFGNLFLQGKLMMISYTHITQNQYTVQNIRIFQNPLTRLSYMSSLYC